MSDTSSASSGSIGFVGLLTIVFITLKLLGKITWSWWWVLSPIWISVWLAMATLICIGIGWVAYQMYKEHKRKKNIRRRITK